MSALETELGNPGVEFSCDHCGERLTVPVAYAGVEGPCPKCGEAVVSPAPVLPEGVVEFVPLNRSNLREEARGVEVADVKKRRNGVAIRGAGMRKFVAKQRIDAGWGEDDLWKEEHREETKKWDRKRELNRRLVGWIDGPRMRVAAEFFAPAAIFIVVGTVVFMKLNGWGLKGDSGVTEADAGSEQRAGVLAEMANSVGIGGEDGGEVEASNLTAFERVRAAATDHAEEAGE